MEERQRFLKTYMSSSGDYFIKLYTYELQQEITVCPKLIVFVLASPGEEPSDTMVEKLLEDVEKYTLASHLTWGLWGIISVFSTITFYHTCTLCIHIYTFEFDLDFV